MVWKPNRAVLNNSPQMEEGSWKAHLGADFFRVVQGLAASNVIRHCPVCLGDVEDTWKGRLSLPATYHFNQRAF
jgi:hypothetical protein